MRFRAAFVAVTMLAITAGSDVSASEPREWAFQVFLEDKPIGRQVFRVTEDGGERRVSIRAELDVKFLFINAYSYRHTNEEIWRDGCLRRIESTTDDNGTPFRVLGEKRDASFVVETDKSKVTLEDCVWSFAYWDESFLSQQKLLNSQTGEYEPVTASLVGDETIEFRGRAVPARRWLLEGPKFRIDLWYSPEREWLALESQSKGGRRLRYVRE
jgi:hypothetical protein